MAFLGEYKHTLDIKNRAFIPAKFRDALGASFVVCKAPEKCLFIYSDEQWDKLSDEIYNLPPDKASRDFQREFFRNADTVEADKQGRITLKASLCEYAGLGKEIVIVGSGRRIELWDEKTWNSNLKELENINVSDNDSIEVHY